MLDRDGFSIVAHHSSGGGCGVNDVIDRGRRGRDSYRKHVGPKKRVYKRRLAVVELSENHQMKSLCLDFPHASVNDVVRKRLHSTLGSEVGETAVAF